MHLEERNLTSFEVLKTLFSNLSRTGKLKVIDDTGKSHSFGETDGPVTCIRFHDPSAYWKLMLNPNLSLGELYMDGVLTIEEGDLRTLLKLLIENFTTHESLTGLWMRALDGADFCLRRLQQINTPQKSRTNVSHHYDLPVEFYQLFLDPAQQYSCAYFRSESDSLEEAQKNKMKHIFSKLMVEPGHEVLDIGCGWGSLACYIAQETGAHVTGITLSRKQHKYAQEKAHELGLSDRVRFRLCDYRILKGPFDRIVSVGMFEHVGVNHYGEFFRKMKSLLSRNGIALLHSIGRFTGPSATNPWIRKYIFPGGYIPALSEVIPHVEKSGLFLTDLEILRLHYARTLNHWSQRFAEQKDHVRATYGERFYRMWEFYLASSEVSFTHFGNMVFQMQLSGNLEAVPLTRDYLYDPQTANRIQ